MIGESLHYNHVHVLGSVTMIMHTLYSVQPPPPQSSKAETLFRTRTALNLQLLELCLASQDFGDPSGDPEDAKCKWCSDNSRGACHAAALRPSSASVRCFVYVCEGEESPVAGPRRLARSGTLVTNVHQCAPSAEWKATATVHELNWADLVSARGRQDRA